MQRFISGRWAGKRSNGRACTVIEVTEHDDPGVTAGPACGSYVLIDHEPTAVLAKGRYQVLPCNDVVTCDHPDAP